MLTACLAGLMAGTIHVFTGPDHLAALAPLSIQARRRAWSVGMRWGLGHSAGVLVVAAAAFAFRSAVHLEGLEGWGERLVGITLVALGLWGFLSLFKNRLHAHPHAHDGREHVHFHVHGGEGHAKPDAHVHTHAAFLVGTLHGLAGTSHLLGVLPSLALPTWKQTASYLGAFAAGTILAMTLFAAVVGFIAPARAERGMTFYRWALGVTSAVCMLVGVAWITLPFFGVPLP
jgi:sulfite exporter TauE/SafE